MNEENSSISGYLEAALPLMKAVEKKQQELCLLLDLVDEKDVLFRSTQQEWSIVEVVGHISDAFELFASHIRHIAHGEQGVLLHVDQEQLVLEHGYHDYTLSQVRERLDSQHQNFILLLHSLPDEAWFLTAMHAQWGNVSIQRLVQMLSRHHEIHIAQIQSLHENM